MSHSLPMVFHTADLPLKDRVTAYKDDILGCCKPDEVAERFAKYVAQNVEAGGWQAVWRSTPTSSGHHQPFDIVVEVVEFVLTVPRHVSLDTPFGVGPSLG